MNAARACGWPAAIRNLLSMALTRALPPARGELVVDEGGDGVVEEGDGDVVVASPTPRTKPPLVAPKSPRPLFCGHRQGCTGPWCARALQEGCARDQPLSVGTSHAHMTLEWVFHCLVRCQIRPHGESKGTWRRDSKPGGAWMWRPLPGKPLSPVPGGISVGSLSSLKLCGDPRGVRFGTAHFHVALQHWVAVRGAGSGGKGRGSTLRSAVGASTGSPMTSAGTRGAAAAATAGLVNAVAVFCVPPPDPSHRCWVTGSQTGRGGASTRVHNSPLPARVTCIRPCHRGTSTRRLGRLAGAGGARARGGFGAKLRFGSGTKAAQATIRWARREDACSRPPHLQQGRPSPNFRRAPFRVKPTATHHRAQGHGHPGEMFRQGAASVVDPVSVHGNPPPPRWGTATPSRFA